MTPLSSTAALDAYFLEARSKLLDLAAILDRIDRGGTKPNDPRLANIHKSLQTLQGHGTGRAEAIQQIFSLAYDASWPVPQPK